MFLLRRKCYYTHYSPVGFYPEQKEPHYTSAQKTRLKLLVFIYHHHLATEATKMYFCTDLLFHEKKNASTYTVRCVHCESDLQINERIFFYNEVPEEWKMKLGYFPCVTATIVVLFYSKTTLLFFKMTKLLKRLFVFKFTDEFWYLPSRLSWSPQSILYCTCWSYLQSGEASQLYTVILILVQRLRFHSETLHMSTSLDM